MNVGKCKNFLISGGSCCDADSFRRFANTYNNVMNIMLNNTKYPIIAYLYTLISNL